MGPFEMVVAIVAITTFAGIWKSRHRSASRGSDQIETAENQRLRDEVKILRDRLAVLERITIEKENSLEREIEQLRDR